MALDDLKFLMIGIILSITVIVSGILIFTPFHQANTAQDPTDQFGNFSKALNRADNITSSVNGISSSISGVGSTNSGPLGWLDTLIGGTYRGLKAIGQTIGFVNDMGTESASIFGIPPTIVALILLIIVVIVGFAIWAAITRTV